MPFALNLCCIFSKGNFKLVSSLFKVLQLDNASHVDCRTAKNLTWSHDALTLPSGKMADVGMKITSRMIRAS
jgi:hypothetical protein